MEGPGSDNKDSEESIYNKITTEYKNDVIKEALKQNFVETKTKIQEESVELIREIMKAVAVEAAIRSAKQATSENKTTVTVNHVETMLLQLLLDFP